MKNKTITLNDLDRCLEFVVHQRFSDKQELVKQLSRNLNFEINLQEKENLNTDYCFIGNLTTKNKEIYLDIYYLIDLEGKLYITDYSFDSETRLKDSDFNLKIKGNAK